MELEEVKSHYRNKITEMEATIKKHERKGTLSFGSVYLPGIAVFLFVKIH